MSRTTAWCPYCRRLEPIAAVTRAEEVTADGQRRKRADRRTEVGGVLVRAVLNCDHKASIVSSAVNMAALERAWRGAAGGGA